MKGMISRWDLACDSRLLSQIDGVDLAFSLGFEPMPLSNAGPVLDHEDGQILQMSTNDYLGLCSHSEIRRVATEHVARHGLGAPMGSRAISGTTLLHLELEEKLARFKGTEAALLFSVGANAMMGALAALAGEGDLVILDQYAHASLRCGARLSRAEIRTFQHNDVEHLASILTSSSGRTGRLVVVDGVYSMSGDTAPLVEICELCDRHGAVLMVDDAHGTGVFGGHGGGLAEQLGVGEQIDIHAGTFSKAFGLLGGFIAAPARVVAYLRRTAPTYLFTKALPGAYVAALHTALDLVRGGTDLRARLWSNTRTIQTRLRSLGFDLGTTSSPITPIRCQDMAAGRIAEVLRRRHRIWAAPVVYPAVPRGESIIRVIATAAHEQSHIDRFCTCLVEAVSSLKLRRLAS